MCSTPSPTNLAWLLSLAREPRLLGLDPVASPAVLAFQGRRMVGMRGREGVLRINSALIDCKFRQLYSYTYSFPAKITTK